MRTRRTDCKRGRTLNLLDLGRPCQKRPFEVRGYVTDETGAAVRKAAAMLGVTMGGLVAFIVERSYLHGELATATAEQRVAALIQAFTPNQETTECAQDQMTAPPSPRPSSRSRPI